MGVQARGAGRKMGRVIRALDVGRGRLAAPGRAAVHCARKQINSTLLASVDQAGESTARVTHYLRKQSRTRAGCRPALIPRSTGGPRHHCAGEHGRRRGGPGGASCKQRWWQ